MYVTASIEFVLLKTSNSEFSEKFEGERSHVSRTPTPTEKDAKINLV